MAFSCQRRPGPDHREEATRRSAWLRQSRAWGLGGVYFGLVCAGRPVLEACELANRWKPVPGAGPLRLVKIDAKKSPSTRGDVGGLLSLEIKGCLTGFFECLVFRISFTL